MKPDQTLIAVAGAGRMGTGIAQVFAAAGYQVHLLDFKSRDREDSFAALDAAREAIGQSLGLLASLSVLTDETAARIQGRIHCHPSASAAEVLEQTGVVFEAAPEILAVKRFVLAEIGAHADTDTLIASTTSTFLADTLAVLSGRPERFINTHWLNPAYLMPLVEVSPNRSTAPEVLEQMTVLLQSVGKVPVRCAPSPGFIVPRIQALAMNEAARMVAEGVAAPADIDQATRLGFGLRFAVLGLLEFIDWGGGDTLFYAGSYLQQALAADRFAPPAVVAGKMADGHTGLKTGRGFYDYRNRDVAEYQKETMKKFVDLLAHLGLLPVPQ